MSTHKVIIGALLVVGGLGMSARAEAITPPIPCSANNVGEIYVTYPPRGWVVTWECTTYSGWVVVTRCTPEGFCE